MLRTDGSDGGPAFPYVAEGGQNNGCNPELEHGMSLRDWFAGQALAGLLASPRGTPDGAPMTDKFAAKVSYMIADAMLVERDK